MPDRSGESGWRAPCTGVNRLGPCVVDHDQAIAFELRFPGPLTAIAMVAVTDARACRFAQLNERARSAFLEGAAEESTRASRPGYLS